MEKRNCRSDNPLNMSYQDGSKPIFFLKCWGINLHSPAMTGTIWGWPASAQVTSTWGLKDGSEAAYDRIARIKITATHTIRYPAIVQNPDLYWFTWFMS